MRYIEDKTKEILGLCRLVGPGIDEEFIENELRKKIQGIILDAIHDVEIQREAMSLGNSK